MKLLVTGGSGFIGGHIAQRLALRHEVLAPTHGELDLTDALAVAAWLDRHQVEAVVHAAVKPAHRNAKDLSSITEDNLRQFFSLVRSRSAFGRFVVLGSGAAYGMQRPLVRVREDALGEAVPEDAHGFSKYVEALWLAGDQDAVELRAFGVYGPGEDYAIRFISNACCKAVLGLPITLRVDRYFSYIWVDDLAAVVEHALHREEEGGMPAGAYNVVPDEAVSLRAIADLVLAIHGATLPVLVGEEGLGPEYSGSNAKLRQALPGLALTRLRTGVEDLYEYYASRRDWLDRAALLVDK